MKKLMLILMLVVWYSTANAAWFGDEDKQEPKVSLCQPKEPEIVAGQIWEYKAHGDKREVFEVGEKYIIYGYTNGGDRDYPSIKTREKFLKYFKLIEDLIDITSGSIAVDIIDGITFWNTTAQISKEPIKPYLHKNPNNDHWICSKHGDLESGTIWTISVVATTISFGDDQPKYCYQCAIEVINQTLNQHITGVKENE